MQMKFRCNRKTISEQGDKTSTEFSFVPQAKGGAPLQANLPGGSININVIDDKENTEFSLNDILTVELVKDEEATKQANSPKQPA